MRTWGSLATVRCYLSLSGLSLFVDCMQGFQGMGTLFIPNLTTFFTLFLPVSVLSPFILSWLRRLIVSVVSYPSPTWCEVDELYRTCGQYCMRMLYMRVLYCGLYARSVLVRASLRHRTRVMYCTRTPGRERGAARHIVPPWCSSFEPCWNHPMRPGWYCTILGVKVLHDGPCLLHDDSFTCKSTVFFYYLTVCLL